MNELFVELAHSGLMGALLAIMLALFVRKDRELQREREARVNDAKDYTKLAVELQRQVMDSVAKLSEIFTELKQERRRERA
jgi:hypothetical protein